VSEGFDIIDFLQDESCIEDDYVTKEIYATLRKVVDNLSEKLKDVIEFVYLDNLGTLRDYSRINNLNYNTVIKRKNLAIDKLRSLIEV